MAVKAADNLKININEAWKWRQIESVIHDTMSLFNFQEIRPSVLSNYPLISHALAHFKNQKLVEHSESTFLRLHEPNQDLCLRPEGTITILNSSLADKARSEIQKLYYLGPMFRKNEKDEIEEINQLGIEILGSSTLISDDEAIRLSLQLCKKFGFNNSWVEISSHGCERCRAEYIKKRAAYLVEHKADICPACSDKTIQNPSYVPDCSSKRCKEILARMPKIGNSLCEDCSAQFNLLQRTLSNLTTNYKINHDLKRSFGYYRQTVFNVLVDTSSGSQIIGGGGRYDDLSQFVTGHPLPSVGFALDLDKIFYHMDNKHLFIQPDNQFRVYICMQTPGLETIIMQISEELRSHNFSTVIGTNCEDFQKECDLASKQNCATMIVINANDVREGKVLLKNFLKEHQEYIKLSDLIPQLTVIRKTFM